jgi:hypothetical protein
MKQTGLTARTLHGNHTNQQDDQAAEMNHHNLKSFECRDRLALLHCRTSGSSLFNRIIKYHVTSYRFHQI